PDAARPDGRLFQNAPARTLTVPGSTFATDAAGLRARDAEQPAPLPRAEATDVGQRILFLGDSVTLGWGVDFEDTWIHLLEQESRAPDGRAIEALNAGHLQYNTIQEVDWFLARGVHFEPDVVVLTAVVNDLDDSFALYQAFAADQARLLAEGPTATERWMGRVDVWAPGLLGLWNHHREQNPPASDAPALPIAERPQYLEQWPLAAAALDRLLAGCNAIGARLIVFDHTTPRLPGYQEWCEANDVPWHDFTFTPAEWAEPIRNSAADAHANPNGHRMLKEKASAALAQDGAILRP
ncbi:MAG: SGNH/GDSL hydrolase family protein, partial [Planctomycetota bacterium]